MCNCKIPVLLVVFAVFSGFVQAQEISGAPRDILAEVWRRTGDST